MPCTEQEGVGGRMICYWVKYKLVMNVNFKIILKNMGTFNFEKYIKISLK
jgi:hypothetical protein